MKNITEQLNLAKGKWLATNCDEPSKGRCKMVIMAPESQRKDLVDMALEHAVKMHGMENDADLRKGIDASLEKIEI